jgi:hypothetical protein
MTEVTQQQRENTMKKTIAAALLILAATTLSGCGLLRDAGYPQGICRNGTVNGQPANCHVAGIG